ncbi:hypothetical protein [Rhizobium sp. Root1203]|uniref:hypothetical protein n=1 Tax=Rhizobium sp. Root1203 TaxID=1736427 RepID=UPI0012E3A780|nr:hypothetical protein [Rhizobium sp. Root1203]
MTAKMLTWLAAGLAIIVVGLGISLRLTAGRIETLKAEKIVLQQQLDVTTADLKISVENHNRIVSEQNRLLAAERERAAAEQSAAVESARIAKDIEYAEDGTKCRDSDPVQRLLRGLWNAQQHSGSQGVDPIRGAGRPGKATGVP